MSTDQRILELRRWFEHHPPRTDQRRKQHEGVRENCLDLALFLDETLPEGDEKEEAIRKVREAMNWANTALACQPDDGART